jgi:transposase-like protein
VKEGMLELASAEDRRRMIILSKEKAQQSSLREASEKLGIGYRQCKRLWKRYLEGDHSSGSRSETEQPPGFRAEGQDCGSLSGNLSGLQADSCLRIAGRRGRISANQS